MTVKKRTLENQIYAAPHMEPRFLRRRLLLAAAAGLIALGLVACGTGDAATPDAASDDDGRPTVVIEGLAFEPDTLTVETDDMVTWVWKDGAIEHDVSGDGYKSEIKSEGTFRLSFDEPGTYEYVCTLHPNMTGTIEVTE